MLQVKKITLSGFRGILKSQELDLCVKGDSTPRSLALYGLNSSGKTSFVDGIEWFLSANNKIEWLTRQDAEEKAYPHQAVDPKKDSSFVELEFADTTKQLKTLRKTYNFGRITQPAVSAADDFHTLYGAYVIRPYLRYLEVIDFVYNRTGLEKYQKLASWMGFEDELAFQEKVALKILPELKRKREELDSSVKQVERQLKQVMNSTTTSAAEVLQVANRILTDHQKPEQSTLTALFEYIPEFAKLRVTTSAGKTIEALTQAETTIRLFVSNTALRAAIDNTRLQIAQFKQEQAAVDQLDTISLYDKALAVLAKRQDASTQCPVCGVSWQREELVAHIRQELELLNKVKSDRESILSAVADHKGTVKAECEAVKRLVAKYAEVNAIIGEIEFPQLSEYQRILTDLEEHWLTNPLGAESTTSLAEELCNQVAHEQKVLLERIADEKAKIQPSPEDTRLSDNIEKLNQILIRWRELEEAQAALAFTSTQIDSFVVVSNKLISHIQDNIKSRFDEISDRIATYFGVLRNDKDIKEIKIMLNEEKGKAAGRSAEIQLHYYDVTVKPAYKVLSESLLNSLGLAVYFACIKQFNTECRFIVLDDIMNSLDIDKRDTVLDLIQQEFGDYQVILFTHDFYWFQKIITRFPQWIHKKIKGWSYEAGARIDAAISTHAEIAEHLEDATKIEQAGWLLARHVESRLNELCEDLQAEVIYRYRRNDPPSMEELFTSLAKRMKSKVAGHPAEAQVLEAKKFEPLLRNFVSHARSNASATISPTEVTRAATEWFRFEEHAWCTQCNQFVKYNRTKDTIECYCGKTRWEKAKTLAKRVQTKSGRENATVPLFDESIAKKTVDPPKSG